MNRPIDRVVCFGELLLRLSAPGKELLLQSPHLEVHIGGAEANVAVSLRKLGHPTCVATHLPDNTLGHRAADELRRHGVEVAAVHAPEERMGLYFLTPGAGHRPADVLYDRANSAFARVPPGALDWQHLLQGASWLHISGITPAVSRRAAAEALDAMRTARAASVAISFDCNFRARVWGERASEAPQVLRELCQHVDVIFGEERDLNFMFGTSPAAAITGERSAVMTAAFKEFKHLKWLVHTSRTRHSVEVQDLVGSLHGVERSYTSRSYSLHGIVDRIGAGDAFAAGILHGLLQQFTPQKTLEFGTAAACLKHSIPGDFNLVSAADVELLLSESSVDVRR
jgi:2-dehydro-3-deoxygluconokinase